MALKRRRRSEKSLEKLQRWRMRVSRAQKVRADWEREYRIDAIERNFLGLKPADDRSRNFNYLWATIKTQKPNLFYVAPKFFVRSKPGKARPAPERRAAIGEGVLHSIADQDLNLKRAGTLALLQAYIRIGVIKAVFDPRLEDNPKAGEPIFATNEDGEVMRNPLGDPTVIAQEPEQVVTDQAYRWEWVDAKNMLLPDEGPDMSRWTWIGEEVVLTLEEAKEEPNFKSELRKRITANETARKPGVMPAEGGDTASKEDERFRFFLIWDHKEKRVLAFANGQKFDEFLRDEPMPDGVEDNPYAILPGWTPIMAPEPKPWPMPHVWPWLDVQEERNIRRSQTTEGAKRSARKIYFDDNTFADEDEAVKALQSSRDMEAVKLHDVTRPPATMQDPPLPPDLYKDLALLEVDWRFIAGQSGAKLADPDSDTATEASIVDRASNLRDADMQDAVNDWLSTAGQKMFQLLKDTLTLDLWVKIRGFDDQEFQDYVARNYGEEILAGIKFLPGLKESFMERFGKEEWLSVGREMLQFEADVTVVPGSSRPRNLDVERQQWLGFLRVIGQFPQLALSRELLRETAAKFEYISERMLDEIHALAKRMVEINARQAGREPNAGQSGNGGGQLLANLLAAATGGRAQ